jgi:hypothetical protein
MTRLIWIAVSLSLYACGSSPDPRCDDPDGCSTSPDASVSSCGNRVCETGETQQNCPEDCGTPNQCGDNTCEATETAQSCPSDCSSTLIVNNVSGQTVFYLYAWRCGTTSKGTDLLGSSTTLPTNYHVEFDDAAIGCWNFEADALNSSAIYSASNQNIYAQVTYTWNVY